MKRRSAHNRTIDPLEVTVNRTILLRRVPIVIGVLALGLVTLAGCGADADDEASVLSTTAAPAAAGAATLPGAPTTPAPTTTPTPAPASTPAPAPTTTEWVNPFSDAEIASRLILDVDEYAPGWQIFEAFRAPALDQELAASIPSCSSFVSSVFESDETPNTVAWRWFHTPPGQYGAMNQTVIVFPSDESAQTMFAATVDPAFTGACVPAYRDRLAESGGLYCRDPAIPFFPSFNGEPIPTLDTMHADDIAFRSFEEYWEDGAGTLHGPDSLQFVTVRVGRTVSIIETKLADETGATFNTEEQFHRAIGAFVDRARHALGGVDHR